LQDGEEQKKDAASIVNALVLVVKFQIQTFKSTYLTLFTNERDF
jgi:hypothetical protein